MAKKLDFKDFLNVDYAPGMPDLIKKNAKKRKSDDGAGTNAEYSSRYAPDEQIDTVSEAVPPGGKPLPALTPDQAHKWLDQGKHAKALASKRGMGWETKMVNVKQERDVKNKQHHVHVHQYTEETEIDEALNPQQRRARARLMMRLKPRIALGRKRAERRFADPQRLKVRARKAARKAIFSKISKDIPKDEMTYQRRQEIEKRLDTPVMKKRIERLAVKMLPKVRKMEIERKRGQQSDN
jgi:hypothetical protein